MKYNAVDISEILEEVLEELGVEKTIIIFRMLPKDVSVEVFSHLPSDDQVAIVHGITDREITYIIDELDFDDKIDVLEELPANIVDKILGEHAEGRAEADKHLSQLSRHLRRKPDDSRLHQSAGDHDGG